MKINSAFNGFPREGIAFLKNLERNNNRDWFQKNKQVFKRALEEPAKSFLEEMSEALAALTGESMGGKVFRIYRDVQFSKDKTPYNAHIRMSFMGHGCDTKACGDNPMFHFSLEPETLTLGVGCFEFSKDMLPTYQDAVANDERGASLEIILADMIRKQFRIESPGYKRVPKGFDPDHPRGPYLRRKGLTVWQGSPIPKELSEHRAVNRCIAKYREMLPVYQWLEALN
jgi:uncharacterized protein (TIGR02453 family)